MRIKYLTVVALITVVASCTTKTKENPETSTKLSPDVELATDMGTMVIRLYDETPQHRDNFIKLASENFFDSILFHRVIEKFMIQAGDPSSKKAKAGDRLGNDDLPYQVPAEFHPDRFHKRGALGAARDGNPARASSSTQFYIVQGRVYNDSTLEYHEGRINKWLAMNRVENDSANQNLVAVRNALRQSGKNPDSLELINKQYDELVEKELKAVAKYVIPNHHREVYKSIGGAAHLDQNYTVFGEVIEGLEIIDKIAASPTDSLDRPVKDVRIIGTKLVGRNN